MEKIVIPSKIEKLVEVEKLVDKLSAIINFNANVYANMLVAVTEAVNNSILHGNNSNLDKNVIIKYEYNDKSVLFDIEDEGKGFNFMNIPDPTSPDNIEKEEGRGIFLMKCLSDEIIFNDKGNQVSLKFFIS